MSLIACGLAWFFYGFKSKPKSDISETTSSADFETDLKAEPVEVKPPHPRIVEKKEAAVVLDQKRPPLPSKSLTPQEIRSVKDLTHRFVKALSQRQSPQQFISELKALDLKPAILNEGQLDPLTRTVIIRTENSLIGTRYIHAQYMGSKGSEFIQHISFQIRPSETSFQQAEQALHDYLPRNKTTTESHPDFKIWSLPDDYVAWVKVMDLDDLKSNKYNAIEKSDVGSVIIVVEKEIH